MTDVGVKLILCINKIAFALYKQFQALAIKYTFVPFIFSHRKFAIYL